MNNSYRFKRIVVKVGSNVLTRPDGTLDTTRMSALTDQLAALLLEVLSALHTRRLLADAAALPVLEKALILLSEPLRPQLAALAPAAALDALCLLLHFLLECSAPACRCAPPSARCCPRCPCPSPHTCTSTPRSR